MNRALPSTSRRSYHGRAGRIALAALSAVTLSVAGVIPANAATADTVSTYIVDAPTLSALRTAVSPIAADAEVLPEMGKAIVELTAAEAKNLDAKPGVSVAPDAYLSVTDAQDDAPWNLDRLDQSTPSVNGGPAGQYWYPDSAGAGVRIYILDSGTRADHPDLNGRVIDGFDAINSIEGPTTDCNGHGTAVASAAAGTVYGVAKLATIVPVQAGNCSGQASTSAIIRGLDWIAASNPAGTPAVVNISLGAMDKTLHPAFAALESSITDLIASGILVTIAAGNDAGDATVPEACQFSPARTPTAFTVGAADAWAGGYGIEGRADFSNAGSCVDAFAPGVSILTASVAGADSYRNGTSFAAPIVAGLAAIHLADHRTDTPAQTTSALLAAAQPGALVDNASRGLGSTVHYDTSAQASTVKTASPNLLVRTPAAVPSTSGVVAGLRDDGRTTSTLKYAWTAPTTGVRLRIDGGLTPARTVDVPSGTSYTFTGLADATTYQVEATTISDGLVGAASVTLLTKTGQPQRVTPAAVQSLSATLVPASGTAGPKARLAWSVPEDLGMTATTDYVIQYSKGGGAWTTYADGTSVARTFTSPQLTASTAYSFRVFAKNGGGTGPGAAVAFTTSRERPDAVRALTATPVPATKTSGPKSVLTWAAPADQGFTAVTDYIIQSSKNGGAWTTYSDGVSAARTFTTPPLAASSAYTFRVFAVGGRGTGPAATVEARTTSDRPQVITELRTAVIPATGTVAPKISLAWTAPADQGFTAITDYVIQWSKNGGAWATYEDGVGVGTTLTTPALSANSAYAFKVSAVNSYGPGASASVQAAIGRDRPSAVQGVTAANTASATGPVTNVTWSVPADQGFTAITDFIIQYSTSGGAWVTVADGKNIAQTVSVPLGSSTATRVFRVFAVNSFGTGPSASTQP